MAKYKYIGNNRPNREHGKTYDGKSKANDWCYSVSELSLKHPNEWKLIEEKNGKTTREVVYSVGIKRNK